MYPPSYNKCGKLGVPNVGFMYKKIAQYVDWQYKMRDEVAVRILSGIHEVPC